MDKKFKEVIIKSFKIIMTNDAVRTGITKIKDGDIRPNKDGGFVYYFKDVPTVEGIKRLSDIISFRVFKAKGNTKLLKDIKSEVRTIIEDELK